MSREQLHPRSIKMDLDSHLPWSFRCQRCGRCCFGPSRRFGIKLFYQEVQAIQGFLGELGKEDFEEFAWDYCTSFGSAENIGDPSFLKVFKESLKDFFFSVSQSSTDKKNLYVEYYVLKTYSDSGRCIFYDPLTRSCLIHEVRPHTCRLYPFYAEINMGEEHIKIGSYPEEACPGLRCGKGTSIFELGEKALALAGSMTSHYTKLAELMETHDTQKAAALNEFYVKKLTYRLASQEQMAREYKNLSSEKYRGIEAKDLFMEKGLIAASEEYRRRLKGA